MAGGCPNKPLMPGVVEKWRPRPCGRCGRCPNKPLMPGVVETFWRGSIRRNVYASQQASDAGGG